MLVSAPEGFDFAPCLVQSLPEDRAAVGLGRREEVEVTQSGWLARSSTAL